MEHNMLYGTTLWPASMNSKKDLSSVLPAFRAIASPARTPLVPEQTDFLDGEEPPAERVSAFLREALATIGNGVASEALVPWMCDVLLSKHSLKAYGRDLVDFARHMEAQGVAVLEVGADHVKLYKR